MAYDFKQMRQKKCWIWQHGYKILLTGEET